MAFLPPWISPDTLRRNRRCPGCSKLTDPKGETCCYCGRPISDEDRARMQAAHEAGRQGSLLALAVPLGFVLLVVLFLLGW